MADDNTIEYLFVGTDSGLDEAFGKVEAGAEGTKSAMAGVNQEAQNLDSQIQSLSGAFDTLDGRASAIASSLSKIGIAASGSSEAFTTLGDDIDSSLSGADDAAGKLAEGFGNLGKETKGVNEHLENYVNEAEAASGTTKFFGEALKEITEMFHKVAGATSGVSPEFAESMHSAAGATGVLSTGLEALLTPVGAVVAAIAAVAAVAVGAAFTLFEFASSAGEAGDRIYLMSQRTGIAAENLSVLSVGASLAGTSLERVTLSIQMLQNRMQKASESTGNQGKALRELHLDTNDANKALEQLFEHLSKIEDPAKRSQEAVRLMGFRMGRDFGQVVTELMSMGMSIDEVRSKLEAMGIDFSEEGTKKAHEFETQLKLLGFQWSTLKDKIEAAALPIVMEWLEGISKWLIENQEQIKRWGENFVNAMGATVASVEGLLGWLGSVAQWFADHPSFRIVIDFIFPGAAAVDAMARNMGNTGPTPMGDLDRQSTALHQQFAEANKNKMNAQKWGGRYEDQSSPMGRGALTKDLMRDKTDNTSAIARYESQEKNLASKMYEIDSEIAGRRRNDLDKLGASSATKPPPGGGGGHKGGGGKGGDPAQEALAMQKLVLAGDLIGFKAQEDALSASYQRREISLKDYTAKALAIESKRVVDTISELNKELESASHLKKGKEKAEKEINNKILAETARNSKDVTSLNDKLDEEVKQKALITENNRLAVYQERASQLQARVSDNVHMRVMSEEEAATLINKSDIDLYEKRLAVKQKEWANADEGSAEQKRIDGDLAKMEQEKTGIIEANERRVRDARQATINQMRQFESSMRAANNGIIQTQLETEKIAMEHQIGIGGANNPNDQRRLRNTIAIAEEEAKYKQQKLEESAKLEVDLEFKTEEEKARIRAAYLATSEAEEKNYLQKIKNIREQWKVDLAAGIATLAGTVSQDLDTAIAEGFSKGIKAGAVKFGQGVLQIIHGAAMKQMQESLTNIFQGMAGKGGVLGKIFEKITGVTQDKALNTNSLETLHNTTAILANNALLQASALGSGGAGGGLSGWRKIALGAAGLAAGAASGGKGDIGGLHTAGKVPLFAAGTDYVPYDMIAGVHKGEAIVPASENRGGRRGGNTTVNLTLNAPVMGGSSYASPRSQREYLEMLTPAVHGALASIG